MKKIFLIAVCSILPACTTMKINADRLAKVKTVAVVGFSVNQETTPGLTDLFRGKTKDAQFAKIQNAATHATEMYKNLVARLEKEQGWKVLKIDQLASHPAYKEVYKTKTEGWQGRPMIDGKTELFQAQGILDTFAIHSAEKPLLEKLKKDLKVDAIVIANLNVRLNNTASLASLVGVAEYKPNVNMSFVVNDLLQDEAAWFDYDVKGPQIEQGSKNFLGMTEESKITQLVIQASDLAYTQLFENKRNAK
jgi:hypothetical protein